MDCFTITRAFENELNAIRGVGKTPWVIINETNEAFGPYVSRTHARTFKENLVGKIVKADEVNFTIAKPVKAPAPKVTSADKIEILHESVIPRPCKQVWHIADEMIEANPMVKRGAVLAECVARGIAYYTARTQYQQWLSVRKDMEIRELLQKRHNLTQAAPVAMF